MSERQFKNHEEFFERVGDDFLRPMSFGECLWPVTVEEMYQHFRARLLDELHESASNVEADSMAGAIAYEIYHSERATANTRPVHD